MTPKQQTFVPMGIHSTLTTIDPVNYPVTLSDDTTEAVAIPAKPAVSTKIDPAELAAVLTWSAQIESDLSQ